MQHNPTRILPAILAGLLLWAAPATAENDKQMIKQAESAAPESISKEATILGRDRSVLREGTNGWTCMPNTMPNDNAPMCNDAVWMKMMQAMGEGADFSTDEIGVSYMLKGDGKGGGVSNSDPGHPNAKEADDYVETGPHLMIILPKHMLEGITDDPDEGGPWVMWKDTPYAHIMVPIEDMKK